MAQPPQALDDLCVIELPCYDPMPFFAASMAARALGAMGAEVIKLEPPGRGAAERRWGPYPGERRHQETTALHLYLNANKQSVTLDLAVASDRELLMRLLARADLLFNPNLPIVNARLGLAWRELIARFPRLIAVSTTFFGADSNYRGGDLVASHMSVVGYGTPMQQVTDPATQPPLRLGGRQSDYVTGYTAAAAALCALRARDRNHGQGMHVDVSQWLAMAQMCRPELSVYTHEAPDAPYRKRLLIRSKSSIQYMFPCKDGWVSCGLASNNHWRALKTMMGNPEWAESEMFGSFDSRLAHSDALEAVIIEWLSSRTRAQLFELAQASHVPAFPVNSPAEVANNPQYTARNYFIDCDHPVAGKVRMPGAPMIFSRTPWRMRTRAPLLGEDNLRVLGNRLGLDRKEIEEIAARSATLLDSFAMSNEAIARGDILEQPATPSAFRLPFEGIRVADFGWIYALPYATAWLAALGAEVVRIETARRPDLVRYLSGTDGKTAVNRSGIFNGINFSKRSVTLDLTHPEGQRVARRLVGVSDLVTENFTLATMRRFKLDYDNLRSLKPDLIMLSGTSLGQTGPLANTVGWGPTNQAFAGTSHLTGYGDGTPSAGGGTWPDFAVGIGMLFALLAAMHHRERTGEGQYIDVSMCEVVTSMMPEAMLEYFMNGRELGAIGNRDPEMAPHGVFRVRGDDRWIALAIASDAEFAALCEVLGISRLPHDPRYLTVTSRLRNVASLDREIESATVRFDRDELAGRLRARGLAAGPVYGAVDLMHDPAFGAAGMMVKLKHKECGERLTPGLPVRFSAFTPDYRPAPLLGEHTEEVLNKLLGYPPEEIAELRAAKILV